MTNPLHDAFSWILFQTMPDAPPNAIVFEVDAGLPLTPSLVIRAAIFEGGSAETGAMIGAPLEKIVAKDWIAEQAHLRERRTAA